MSREGKRRHRSAGGPCGSGCQGRGGARSPPRVELLRPEPLATGVSGRMSASGTWVLRSGQRPWRMEYSSSIAAQPSAINKAEGSPGAAPHSPAFRKTELRNLAEMPGERLAPRRRHAWDLGAGSVHSNPQHFTCSGATSPNLPLARRLQGPCPVPRDWDDKVVLWKNIGEACRDVGELAAQQGGYPRGSVSPLGEPFPLGMKKRVLAAAPFAMRAPLAPALGQAVRDVLLSLWRRGGCPAEGKGRSHRALRVQKQQRTVAREEPFLALLQAGTHQQRADGKPVPHLWGLYKQGKGKGQRRGAGARVLPPLTGVCACPPPRWKQE